MLHRLVAAGAGLCLLATAAGAAEYRVGLLLPFSGVYASLGEEIRDGFELALEHYRDRLGGDTVVTLSEDTEVKPPVGLTKAKKLVLQDRVDVIAGVVSSGVLAAIRDFVHGAGVPLVVANAGNDLATGERCSRYIVRISFSNSQINRPMGTWLARQGVKRVYAMAPDYAAGRQMIAAFKQTFEAEGGEIVGEVYTPFRKTKDFGPYLTEARAADPDAVYAFYAGGEAIAFVKQYGSFGLAETIPLRGAGFLVSPLYVEAEGDAAVGVVASLHYVPTLDTPENHAFREAFERATGRVPSEYAVQGYDAGRLIVEALATSGGEREKLVEALRRVRFTGPRGPLEIDPATNNIVQNIYVFETVKGEDGRLTQKVLDVFEHVQDPPNGCSLAG